MPELPEVETMTRGLRPALEGRTLDAIRVLDAAMLESGTTAARLEASGRGATVEGVRRRGKWVLFVLGEGRGWLVIQPRMTGGFWLVEPKRPEHVRLKFLVGGKETVWFTDIRRLGRIALYDSEAAAESAFAKSHGPDALEIGFEDLRDRLKRAGRGIKPTLMDQKVLAGIGNIYADESLFRSRIHPERPSSSLSDAEVRRLREAIVAVLREAIAAEGSSFDAGYQTVLGLEGGFLAQNAMYGREGLACPSCESPVVKAKIVGLTGRPTYYCPRCQPKGVEGI